MSETAARTSISLHIPPQQFVSAAKSPYDAAKTP
jgi:hypothetical protein